MVAKRTKGERAHTLRSAIIVLVAFAVYVVLLMAPLGLPAEQQPVIALLALVAILWFSEVAPLFVTALLIPILLVLTTASDQRTVLAAFADPVIGLFFGSFVLALALEQSGIDQRVARLLNRFTRGSVSGVVLGFIVLAAVLGMWISNTATVSLLLPIVLLLIKTGKLNTTAPRLTKSLLFACAMGGAIGGMTTPVGTPPNAIAVRYLAEAGHPITFAQWLSFGLPLMLLLIPIVWLILISIFRAERTRIKIPVGAARRWRMQEVATVVLLLLTIAAWLLEPVHGVPPATVALTAAVICFGVRLVPPTLLSNIPYQALILFGGGLALGDAMVRTGVTKTIVDWISLAGQGRSALVVLSILMLVAVGLTTIASNTASAAMLVPVVLSIAAQAGVDPAPLVIGTTLALSIDFMSPVGTPPATLIHSTGLVHVKDFITVGSVVTVVALALVFGAVLWLV